MNNIDFNQLHLMRPELLWLLPVVIVLWIGLKQATATSHWESYIPKHMLAALRISDTQQSKSWLWTVLASWLILVVAAAGPTWSKQTVPTIENQSAIVIALDLSPSMLAEDVNPNRLTRAKFKLIDILRNQQDGQIALIAYAGEAHTVSPLTDDPRTLESLLPALHPAIMPSSGSNMESAIELANTLLADAGATKGQILVITDGIAEQAFETIQSLLKGNHQLSILGVGGQQAAPIPIANGGFLRKDGGSGEIVLASVNHSALRSLSLSLGGRYAALSNNETDVEFLLANPFESSVDSGQKETTFDAWKDMGHLLVLLALPLVLLSFRKGLVYCLPLLLLAPYESQAADSSSFAWDDLWQTQDQQAAKQLQQQQYQQAADKFSNKHWSAIANYRAGDYAASADQLQDRQDLASLYNRGNALAFTGELEEAIESYSKVLEIDPDHEDAAHNKQVLEKLLQQSEEPQPDGEPQPGEEPQPDKEPQPGEEPQQGENPDEEQQVGQTKEDQSSGEQQESNQQANQGQQKDNSEEPQSEQQAQAESDSKDPNDEDEEQDSAAQADQETKQNSEQEAESIAADVEEEGLKLKDSSEQWLRTIADDPSGLLRRKFEYQAKQRARQARRQAPKQQSEQRY